MKTREEKIIEEIEISFLDMVGMVWGLAFDTNISDDKMKYFNNKGIEIRNELIKKVRKLLSSPEKKEEWTEAEKHTLADFEKEEVEGWRSDAELRNDIVKAKLEIEKEEPTQEKKEEYLTLTFERNQYTGERWVEIDNGIKSFSYTVGELRLNENDLIMMLKLLQDKKLKSKIERLLK